MTCGILLLATALNVRDCGVDFSVEFDPDRVDPGRNVNVTLTARAPSGTEVRMPDLGPRLRGFSDSESVEEEPVTGRDGQVTRTALWKLVPEPCAPAYRIAPFVVETVRNGAAAAFVVGPVRFGEPEARPPAEGAMEIADPVPDRPPFSWRKFFTWCLWTLAALPVLAGIGFLLFRLGRRMHERTLRPLERAWAELSRLLARKLPEKGRYKDFYVELTQLVRRYVQRQHGVRAPHLTTEEFFELTRQAESFPPDTLEPLMDFLRKADLVKFAGVAATAETAAEATESARSYIARDDEIVRARQNPKRHAR